MPNPKDSWLRVLAMNGRYAYAPRMHQRTDEIGHFSVNVCLLGRILKVCPFPGMHHRSGISCEQQVALTVNGRLAYVPETLQSTGPKSVSEMRGSSQSGYNLRFE